MYNKETFETKELFSMLPLVYEKLTIELREMRNQLFREHIKRGIKNK